MSYLISHSHTYLSNSFETSALGSVQLQVLWLTFGGWDYIMFLDEICLASHHFNPRHAKNGFAN
jgi:hypothetical protein